jgi:hypothetical protein
MRHLGMANKARWPVRFVLDEDVTISAISETLAARQEIVALSIATGQMADVVGERVHKLDDAALLRFADLRESLDTGQSDALVISLGEAVVSDLRTARIRTHPDRDCLAIHHRLAAWETRNASAKQPRLIGAEVPANDVLET